MTKLWPIFIFSILMAFLAEKNSIYRYSTTGEKQYICKDKLFYYVMTITMGVFVGLRLWCNDTDVYRETYELLISATKPVFENMDWAIGDNPGFVLSNRILKHMGVSTQNFLMIFALITNVVYLWFLRKYTSNIFLTVFLFYTMGCYTFTMAAIKQTVAVAFCLLGVDRAIQKKWKWFIFWVLLASTFHPYALMYLIVPLLFFSPWSQKTGWMLSIFAVVGIGLQTMLGTIISITSMLGEEYDKDSFVGDGVNIFRLAVTWAPVILSFLARKQMRKNKDRASNMFMNLTMLNASVMFVALFGTANYFARLANYFLIFQTLAIPWMLSFFTSTSKKMLKILLIICYLL